MVPIDFHSMDKKKKTIETSGVHQLFGYDILQYTFFCVQQKREVYTGLEQI